ncbi:MAG: hypothetical protein R3C14_39365 [Caldilineaceae bacterium]
MNLFYGHPRLFRGLSLALTYLFIIMLVLSLLSIRVTAGTGF